MTVARRGLMVKVKVMGQANVGGPTSIESSFSSFVIIMMTVMRLLLPLTTNVPF